MKDAKLQLTRAFERLTKGQTLELSNLAYFSWGNALSSINVSEQVRTVRDILDTKGVDVRYFTMTAGGAQTRGAKPIDQVSTSRKWASKSLDETDNLSILSFSTEDFKTVFEADVSVNLSKGDRAAEHLNFRTQEMLFRMRSDSIYIFAREARLSAMDLEVIGDEISALFLNVTKCEMKRVADMGVASLYCGGANFHLFDEFYTQQKLTVV